MELKRVVVTGLGAVTPVGNSPEETWSNLLAGKSGAAAITNFDASKFKTQFACEVKGLNINDWIDRKESRKLDRYTQFALISAMQGVKDAALDLEKEDLNRIGVVYGVGIGGINTFQEEVTYYGVNRFHTFRLPRPQLHHHECVCIVDQCACRRLQPDTSWQSQHHRCRWCRGSSVRVRSGRLQCHEGPFHTQRRA